MMNEMKEYNETVLDSIKHIDEYGNEYWLARELMKTLEYSKWSNFASVIEKAKLACESSKKRFMIILPMSVKWLILNQKLQEI